MRFGRSTNTYDAEGETVAESGRIPEREALEAAVERFRGPQLQRPPAFSAIKRDGSAPMRWHDRARRSCSSRGQ